MAKLTGPLHSLIATGTIGKAITYTGSTGGARAIRYASPKATGTPARKLTYSNGCAAWHLLDTIDQAAWSAIGKKSGLTGFSAFISNYLLNPPIPGTTWDSETTAWDSGGTTWDTL